MASSPPGHQDSHPTPVIPPEHSARDHSNAFPVPPNDINNKPSTPDRKQPLDKSNHLVSPTLDPPTRVSPSSPSTDNPPENMAHPAALLNSAVNGLLNESRQGSKASSVPPPPLSPPASGSDKRATSVPISFKILNETSDPSESNTAFKDSSAPAPVLLETLDPALETPNDSIEPPSKLHQQLASPVHEKIPKELVHNIASNPLADVNDKPTHEETISKETKDTKDTTSEPNENIDMAMRHVQTTDSTPHPSSPTPAVDKSIHSEPSIKTEDTDEPKRSETPPYPKQSPTPTPASNDVDEDDQEHEDDDNDSGEVEEEDDESEDNTKTQPSEPSSSRASIKTEDSQLKDSERSKETTPAIQDDEAEESGEENMLSNPSRIKEVQDELAFQYEFIVSILSKARISRNTNVLNHLRQGKRSDMFSKVYAAQDARHSQKLKFARSHYEYKMEMIKRVTLGEIENVWINYFDTRARIKEEMIKKVHHDISMLNYEYSRSKITKLSYAPAADSEPALLEGMFPSPQKIEYVPSNPGVKKSIRDKDEDSQDKDTKEQKDDRDEENNTSTTDGIRPLHPEFVSAQGYVKSMAYVARTLGPHPTLSSLKDRQIEEDLEILNFYNAERRMNEQVGYGRPPEYSENYEQQFIQPPPHAMQPHFPMPDNSAPPLALMQLSDEAEHAHYQHDRTIPVQNPLELLSDAPNHQAHIAERHPNGLPIPPPGQAFPPPFPGPPEQFNHQPPPSQHRFVPDQNFQPPPIPSPNVPQRLRVPSSSSAHNSPAIANLLSPEVVTKEPPNSQPNIANDSYHQHGNLSMSPRANPGGLAIISQGIKRPQSRAEDERPESMSPDVQVIETLPAGRPSSPDRVLKRQRRSRNSMGSGSQPLKNNAPVDIAPMPNEQANGAHNNNNNPNFAPDNQFHTGPPPGSIHSGPPERDGRMLPQKQHLPDQRYRYPHPGASPLQNNLPSPHNLNQPPPGSYMPPIRHGSPNHEKARLMDEQGRRESPFGPPGNRPPILPPIGSQMPSRDGNSNVVPPNGGHNEWMMRESEIEQERERAVARAREIEYERHRENQWRQQQPPPPPRYDRYDNTLVRAGGPLPPGFTQPPNIPREEYEMQKRREEDMKRQEYGRRHGYYQAPPPPPPHHHPPGGYPQGQYPHGVSNHSSPVVGPSNAPPGSIPPLPHHGSPAMGMHQRPPPSGPPNGYMGGPPPPAGTSPRMQSAPYSMYHQSRHMSSSPPLGSSQNRIPPPHGMPPPPPPPSGHHHPMPPPPPPHIPPPQQQYQPMPGTPMMPPHPPLGSQQQPPGSPRRIGGYRRPGYQY